MHSALGHERDIASRRHQSRRRGPLALVGNLLNPPSHMRSEELGSVVENRPQPRRHRAQPHGSQGKVATRGFALYYPAVFTFRKKKPASEFGVYMAPVEFSQLLAVLVAVEPRSVLEWGAGGGTIAILERCPFIETYVSIEHNADWYAEVQGRIRDDRLSLHLCKPDEPLANDKPTREERIAWDARAEVDPALMHTYVHLPETLGKKFDFVLVDGRARCFCLATGFALLRPGGVLVLHDAQREEYHAALNALATPTFLEPWEQGQLCVIRKKWDATAPVADAL